MIVAHGTEKSCTMEIHNGQRSLRGHTYRKSSRARLDLSIGPNPRSLKVIQ